MRGETWGQSHKRRMASDAIASATTAASQLTTTLANGREESALKGAMTAAAQASVAKRVAPDTRGTQHSRQDTSPSPMSAENAGTMSRFAGADTSESSENAPIVSGAQASCATSVAARVSLSPFAMLRARLEVKAGR